LKLIFLRIFTYHPDYDIFIIELETILLATRGYTHNKEGRRINFTIFYFSGTGNTWWLATNFKEIVEKSGHIVSLHSLDGWKDLDYDAIKEELIEADAVGIFHPIYSSDAPPIVRDFLISLPRRIDMGSIGRKEAFVLTTMDVFSGTGCIQLQPLLESCNLDLRVARDFQVTSNLGIPILTYNPVETEKLRLRLDKSREELEKTCDVIISRGKRIWIQWSLLGRFMGWGQRVGPKFEGRTYRYLGVDPKRCIMCMECVDNCPTDAITKTDDTLEWTDACTDCFRCYNFCPTQAITVKGRSAKPGRHRQHTFFKEEFLD